MRWDTHKPLSSCAAVPIQLPARLPPPSLSLHPGLQVWSRKSLHLALGKADSCVSFFGLDGSAAGKDWRHPDLRQGSPEGCSALAHNSDGSTLACGTDRGHLCLYSVPKDGMEVLPPVRLSSVHTAAIRDLQFSHPGVLGESVYSCGDDGLVLCHDTRTGDPSRIINPGKSCRASLYWFNRLSGPHRILSLSLSPDAIHLAIGTATGQTGVYNIRTGKHPLPCPTPAIPEAFHGL
eukprot:gene3289-3794_t